MADGRLRLVAVPLEPRDDDPIVVLAVVVNPLASGTSLSQAADDAVAWLGSQEAPWTTIHRGSIDLPAGPAERITTSRPRDVSPEGLDEQRDWYLLVDNDRLIQVYLRSDKATAERYEDEFRCIAETLVLTDAGATPATSRAPTSPDLGDVLVSVPDIRGLMETDGIAALVASGLQPGSRTEISSDAVPAGGHHRHGSTCRQRCRARQLHRLPRVDGHRCGDVAHANERAHARAYTRAEPRPGRRA